jgi:uncharacterized repeat protein (TIGR03803 family)
MFTVGFAPTVTTLAAINGTNGSTLNATVNPEGWDTTVYFLWATPTLSNSTPGMEIGAGATSLNVSSFATGLARLTSYYYQVAASNALGTVFGAVASWNPPFVSVAGHAGVVFTSIHSFGRNDGAVPNALVRGCDGNFYGTAQNGGTSAYGGPNNAGTVFKLSTDGVLTTLHSFTGGINGAHPRAGLVQGSDGKFYGTTSGQLGNQIYNCVYCSTVFQISTNGALTNLYAFHGEIEMFGARPFPAGNDGASPYAGLVQGSDGNFYGTTYYGGTNGFTTTASVVISYGTVFKISTNGAETILNSFGWDFYGVHAEAPLVQGSDGNFYGATPGDGYNSVGTVFEMSTNGALNVLWIFFGTDGLNPNGLIQGSDGYLYGTTGNGGTNNLGTVFTISTNGTYTNLYSFIGGNDGASPVSGLVQGSDGYLYGTTYGGGSSGNGTVFAINTNGTGFTTLYHFSAGSTNSSGVYTNSDGANPQAGLILSGNTLYGTTSAGGNWGYGTVFSLTLPGPQLTITHSGASVILRWPTNAAGYALQATTNLALPAVWATNSPAPVVVNGQNAVTNPISAPQQFFRLTQ